MPTSPSKKKKGTSKPKGTGRPNPNVEYVTKAEFEDFGNKIVDAIAGLAPKAPAPDDTPIGTTSTFTVQTGTGGNPPPVATPETSAEREVRKASPKEVPMNPEWEEMAQEIIGEAVDHCEISYLKNGGVLFTIVVKNEFSNAGADYLSRMGTDRRSREIGQEGLAGVEEWCKLVKSNLARPK